MCYSATAGSPHSMIKRRRCEASRSVLLNMNIEYSFLHSATSLKHIRSFTGMSSFLFLPSSNAILIPFQVVTYFVQVSFVENHSREINGCWCCVGVGDSIFLFSILPCFDDPFVSSGAQLHSEFLRSSNNSRLNGSFGGRWVGSYSVE